MSKCPIPLCQYRYGTGSLPLGAEPGYARESPRVCPPALTIQAHKVKTVNSLADGMFIPILDPDFFTSRIQNQHKRGEK